MHTRNFLRQTQVILFSLCYGLTIANPQEQCLSCLKPHAVKTPPPNPAQPTTSFLFTEPDDAGRFNTGATLLVWQAVEDGLEFAARNHPSFLPSSTMTTDITAILSAPKFPWNPAFKLLLGYHFANPTWDLNGRWTFYYSRPKHSINMDVSPTGEGLFPLWIPPQAATSLHPVYGSAKSTLLLHFNTVDFELAYRGGVSKSLFLKLHGGLKGLIIDQVFRVSYANGISEGASQMISSHTRAKNNCIGLGPRVGLGSKWKLPGGWSLAADTAGAFALCSMVTRREDDSTSLASGNRQTISVHFREAFWVARPLIEVKTGVAWEHHFGLKKQKILTLECAYEIQHYWEQNMMTRYSDQAIFYMPCTNRGNLSLQGVSLTLLLGY